jgi:hypothetical protein
VLCSDKISCILHVRRKRRWLQWRPSGCRRCRRGSAAET